MVGKAIGRLTNTASNLVLGTVNSKPFQKIVGGAFKGIAKSVDPAAGVADATLKGARKAVGKATDKETYKAIGKAVESGAGKTTKAILTDPNSYKQTGTMPKVGRLNKDTAGKPILTSNKTLFADDMNRRISTGLDTIAAISRPLVKGGGDNLLPGGMKATGLGVTAAAAFQFANGTPEAVKTWNSNRQGSNYDNQPVTSAPKTPAYSQNGGATGDLVFALNNLRHGGMM